MTLSPATPVNPVCPDCGGPTEMGTEFGSNRPVPCVCAACHDLVLQMAEGQGYGEERPD